MEELELMLRNFEEYEKRKEEEWNSKSNEEKLAYYEEHNIFLRKYIIMSRDELEKELEFMKNKAKQLQSGFFHDPYYSYLGCLEEMDNINLIKELKGWK